LGVFCFALFPCGVTNHHITVDFYSNPSFSRF
jgi:hypothetical protein